MKKILIPLAVFLIAVLMTACSNTGSENTTEQTPPSSTESGNSQSENTSEDSDVNDSKDSNILVAYFSRVGNTEWENGVDAVASASINIENGEYVGNAEVLAKMAQQATGGDLFLIQTEKTYPSDYRKTTDEAKVEQNNDARPALSSHVENMEKYDTVCVVFPNWWGTLPMAMFTLLEKYDLTGKKIIPFCTNEGSGLDNSESDLQKVCKGAHVVKGLSVFGAETKNSEEMVAEWEK